MGTNLLKALFLAKKAALLSQGDGAIIDTLGWAYYLNGKYDLAIGNLEAASALRPNEPTILYHLGAAYYKRGEKDKALEKLEKSLKINPGFPERENAKRLIREIRKK